MKSKSKMYGWSSAFSKVNYWWNSKDSYTRWICHQGIVVFLLPYYRISGHVVTGNAESYVEILDHQLFGA